jgi:hypothetical protein
MVQAHGGKFSCPWCEGKSNFDATSPMRTYGSMKDWHQKFVAGGSKVKDAPKYKNCIRPCLLKEEDDVLVLDSIPPPQLHLHMGGVNSVMDVVMELWGEAEMLAWCKRNGVMRRGYQGGTFDGNNSKRILEKLEALEAECPPVCRPLVKLLWSFKSIVEGCFGRELDPNYESIIANYAREYGIAQKHLIDSEGNFHDQGDAKQIVIRGQLRGHDTPFVQSTPGRPIGCPGVGRPQGVFGGLSYY